MNHTGSGHIWILIDTEPLQRGTGARPVRSDAKWYRSGRFYCTAGHFDVSMRLSAIAVPHRCVPFLRFSALGCVTVRARVGTDLESMLAIALYRET